MGLTRVHWVDESSVTRFSVKDSCNESRDQEEKAQDSQDLHLHDSHKQILPVADLDEQ